MVTTLLFLNLNLWHEKCQVQSFKESLAFSLKVWSRIVEKWAHSCRWSETSTGCKKRTNRGQELDLIPTLRPIFQLIDEMCCANVNALLVSEREQSKQGKSLYVLICCHGQSVTVYIRLGELRPNINKKQALFRESRMEENRKYNNDSAKMWPNSHFADEHFGS